MFTLISVLSGENPNNEGELMQMLIAIHHPGLRGPNGLFNFDFNYLSGLEPKCMTNTFVINYNILF